MSGRRTTDDVQKASEPVAETPPGWYLSGGDGDEMLHDIERWLIVSGIARHHESVVGQVVELVVAGVEGKHRRAGTADVRNSFQHRGRSHVRGDDEQGLPAASSTQTLHVEREMPRCVRRRTGPASTCRPGAPASTPTAPGSAR